MNQVSHIANLTDTICALATPSGTSAIAVIRISGDQSVKVCHSIFFPAKRGFDLQNAKTHTLHYGKIVKHNEVIDDVLLSVFNKPNSYTGEDSIEISCHGSPYIQQKIIELLIENGIRLAKPGEFTLRAFLNGKFDLTQAEAVADLIASHSKSSHDLALDQMRGGFSSKIKELRQQLLDFASLIELELDFSEEDVEFADRKGLNDLLEKLQSEIAKLLESFTFGQVLKQGIPVAIVGEPNVGKSTLLNAILNEEKAIVSEIPGTTRDSIEDTIVLKGVSFRFIDTAGLRNAEDEIESIGIERTYKKIDQAKIILFVFDVSKSSCADIRLTLKEFKQHIRKLPSGSDKDKKFILIANKTDQLVESPEGFKKMVEMECLFVSAKRKENINLILDHLSEYVEKESISDSTIVSNTRHYEALSRAAESIISIQKGFREDVPSDLIAIDIRQALHYLGEITGVITTDEILGNIFSRFCIGK
ncbi:MAG: tRNA uridine-5-carboxymethylaminomethyl(34) synthesis GTPase MnmE [Bacteroidales bacterium]|nr:tRNA uridine-5-carboxymethylaminomethyl(34) synthesis GTPase MnmE [Bacteroidales bacterium]MCF8405817.1 tRNA uridine-5-carboxymethylaminomethyl(34) synthesis GTPase MnmE [Bacteroidales bacterium]